jgi:hypothetical protein
MKADQVLKTLSQVLEPLRNRKILPHRKLGQWMPLANICSKGERVTTVVPMLLWRRPP